MSDEDATPDIVKVTLSGVGISFERNVPLERAVAIMNAALGIHSIPTSSPADAGPSSTVGPIDEIPLSIREFLDEVDPATNAKTVVAIAEFHRRNGETYISRDDISEGFISASIPEPSNLPRDISDARKKGWLAYRAGSREEFYVTKTGRLLLEKGAE